MITAGIVQQAQCWLYNH